MKTALRYITYILEFIYCILAFDIVLDNLNSPDMFPIGVLLLILFIISIVVLVKINKKFFKK